MTGKSRTQRSGTKVKESSQDSTNDVLTTAADDDFGAEIFADLKTTASTGPAQVTVINGAADAKTAAEAAADDSFWDDFFLDDDAGSASSASSAGSGTGFRSRLFEDMKRLADKSGSACMFVPFTCRWPSYEEMDRLQQAWYFYWRSEVRAGRAPSTALSYLHLHMYELISGVGWQDGSALSALKELTFLWSSYRIKFPQLDDECLPWLSAFCYLYKLPFPELNFSIAKAVEHPAWINRLLEPHRDDKPLKLPFYLVCALSDYDPAQSRFYLKHAEVMRQALPRAAAAADAFFLKTEGRGILKKYGSLKLKKWQLSAFTGALCQLEGKKITFQARDCCSRVLLRELMTNLTRCCENTLRRLCGQRPLTKTEKLRADLAQLIIYFLEQEYAYLKDEAPAKRRTAGNASAKEPGRTNRGSAEPLEFDLSRIDELRAQSEQVRARLEVAEDSGTEPLDEDGARDLLHDLSPALKAFLLELSKSGWQTAAAYGLKQARAVNLKSQEYLACDLFALTESGAALLPLWQELMSKLINEPWFNEEAKAASALSGERSALKSEPGEDQGIQDAAAETPAAAPALAEGFAYPEDLNADLKLFLQALPLWQQRALLQAATAEDDAREILEQAAMQEGSMADQLIFELNNTALDYLNDLVLVDDDSTLAFTEEYAAEFKRAAKAAGV